MINRRFEAVSPTLSIYRPDQPILSYATGNHFSRSPLEKANMRVDEAIRWTSPVKHFMRNATADTQVRGMDVRAMERLMICYPSGNRDEDVFPDADRFDITRSPNPHIAFGFGPHMCLGQHLAKLEMRILFEELLPHLESVEMAGDPRLVETNFVGGYKALPIRFRKA